MIIFNELESVKASAEDIIIVLVCRVLSMCVLLCHRV